MDTEYVLSFKPAAPPFGRHDPSAVVFRNGELVFGCEQERLSRNKHAEGEFPIDAIRACLDYCNIDLSDLEKIILPYRPKLANKNYLSELNRSVTGDKHIGKKLYDPIFTTKKHLKARFFAISDVREELNRLNSTLPPIELREHHACHAATAFHLAPFSSGLVLTLDGKGEYDSTVVWHGTPSGIERIRTYDYPNSLGHFFGTVTEYLGYRAFNGEGKVMGLAPYGEENEQIESILRDAIDTGVDYDVTEITSHGIQEGVRRLERLFNRQRDSTTNEFSQWEKDLAYTAQQLLEETVLDIVETQLTKLGTTNVGLAGGVALNCKMNKRIMESSAVEELFIQPVAHDGGLAVGAGHLDQQPSDVEPMSTVYWGPKFDDDEIVSLLETNKINYKEPEKVEQYTAEKIADGSLVGWFQGRMEMGPRALGNRSILADPRTIESRDNVNEFVKHREGWRPFAPSLLEDAVDEYLVNGEPSPYMIKTFETIKRARDDIRAVVHPADNTTRPQTVNKEQNPRYYKLINEFNRITGVPVLLNTSFNDHGEPIVRSPTEAIKDFYGMGLDVLVLGDVVLSKL